MVQAFDNSRSRHLQVVGGRIPPHNLEAEESLIGAMLLSRDAIAAGVERCTAADFYKPAHSHIYDAVVSLYAKGQPADPVTVADELRRTGLLDSVGDPSLLISLQLNTPSTDVYKRQRYDRPEEGVLAPDAAEVTLDVVLPAVRSLVVQVAAAHEGECRGPVHQLTAGLGDRQVGVVVLEGIREVQVHASEGVHHVGEPLEVDGDVVLYRDVEDVRDCLDQKARASRVERHVEAVRA